MRKYIPSEIEPKWQKKWEEDELYKVDLTDAEKRYYILIEFSYPSGDLHMGHWFAFAVPDILARFKRMQGYNVFFPNGFDAFGLPAENAAIKRGVHPKDWTLGNIEKMKQQFSTMGASFNWENEVITCLPEYYKWNQWIFLKMLEKGIAYKGKALANWCPNCQTVLANENVEAGKCWRCQTEVIQKSVEQWFLKLTEYADKLLWDNPLSREATAEGGASSNGVDWPIPVKVGQNNWIGKSEGMEIDFVIASDFVTASSSEAVSEIAYPPSVGPKTPRNDADKISVYTVFPETIFGVTYMVLAPEHSLVGKLTTKEQEPEIKEYLETTKKKTQLERTSLEKQKTGVFTGSYGINPVNGKKFPIWIADYVIGGYGTGAVMGVPGSDHRDFEFAQKYDLEIIKVVAKNPDDQSEIKSAKDVLEAGWIVNSQQFNGLATPNIARDKIKDWLEEQGFGKRKKQYHIHDWSVSRQRYWGTPIPVIYCSNCPEDPNNKFQISNINGKAHALIPVPDDQLPVELPYNVDYAPKGKPPLATDEEWVKVKCPKCGKEAKRDVETMDCFIDSAWYFFRYLDPKNREKIFGSKVVEDWLPLDIYFGGAEHTLGHTLYSRFFTKFLQDLGLISFGEYAKKRVNRGLILGPDGQKMSKSRGNVVNPDDQVKSFGADAVRLYLAFIGPYAETVAPWDNSGLNGVYHFLQRVWGLQEKLEKTVTASDSEAVSEIAYPPSVGPKTPRNDDLKIMHKTIKRVTEDIEASKFNTAVAGMMEWLNYLSKKDHGSSVTKEEYKIFLLLLAPFAPHMTEELWDIVIRDSSIVKNEQRKTKNDKSWSIHQQSWPSFDNKYLEDEEITVAVQVNGKVRETLVIQKDMISNKEDIEKMALASVKVQKFLEGKSVKKVIHIPGKILSFVV